MRISCRSILILGLALVLAAPAFGQRQRGQGQGRGPGGPGGGGIASLLQNESVQKELKVDKDQAGKVTEAVKTVQDQHADDFAKLRDITNQDERRQKSQELTRTVSEETLKAVSGVLSADQVKRLKQIELQQAGLQAFTRADVQKALSLTDEQKDAIKTLSDEAAKKRQELSQGGRRQGGGQGQSQFAAMRKENMEKVQKLLTADQKKTWKDLTGDAFEIQRPQGRRQQQQ
jgi:hypothetical protein